MICLQLLGSNRHPSQHILDCLDTPLAEQLLELLTTLACVLGVEE